MTERLCQHGTQSQKLYLSSCSRTLKSDPFVQRSSIGSKISTQRERDKILFLSGRFLPGSLSPPVIMCPLKMLVCLDLESDGQRSITSGSVQIESRKHCEVSLDDDKKGALERHKWVCFYSVENQVNASLTLLLNLILLQFTKGNCCIIFSRYQFGFFFFFGRLIMNLLQFLSERSQKSLQRIRTFWIN